ncbi:hypothetical protein [Exiguobacterium profundum]|uniref:hypothetical protein n=1 Tax=Exiguobacterium profundum TaxID=307643 RepID=UPI003515B94D
MAERKVIKAFRDRTSDGQRFHVGELYEGDQERLDELSALGFLEAVEEKPDSDDDKQQDKEPEQAPEEEKPKAKRGRQKKDGDDA